MRTLLVALALVACAPSESLPATCSPACAAGQVCVNAQCLVPADAGADAAQDVAAVDVPAADALQDVVAQDSGAPDAAVDASDADVPYEPRCTPHTFIYCADAGGCADPLTNNMACGRCDNVCVAPATCFMGRCATP